MMAGQCLCETAADTHTRLSHHSSRYQKGGIDESETLVFSSTTTSCKYSKRGGWLLGNLSRNAVFLPYNLDDLNLYPLHVI